MTASTAALLRHLGAAPAHVVAHQFGPAIGAAIAALSRGDLPAAFDTFMTLVCGAGYRRVMTDTLGAGVVDDPLTDHRARRSRICPRT